MTVTINSRQNHYDFTAADGNYAFNGSLSTFSGGYDMHASVNYRENLENTEDLAPVDTYVGDVNYHCPNDKDNGYVNMSVNALPNHFAALVAIVPRLKDGVIAKTTETVEE